MSDSTISAGDSIKFCPNPECRTENPPERRFCMSCGTPLPRDGETTTTATAEQIETVAGPEAAEKPLRERLVGALDEVVQPFIDLVNAPRALWGINLSYFLEGLVYFGILIYLFMYFNQYVGLDDEQASPMVGVLTFGITLSMFFLGTVADRRGIRFALITAFILMLAGRVLLSAAPYLGLTPGMWHSMHLLAMGGIVLVVLGYGMYQPAAYAGVRQFTDEKTAGMAYAMLYALMNLGGWVPTFAYLIRDDKYLGWGIRGTFVVYTGITVVALLATIFILTPRVVRNAIADAKEKRGKSEGADTKKKAKEETAADTKKSKSFIQEPQRPVPAHLSIAIALLVVAITAYLFWYPNRKAFADHTLTLNVKTAQYSLGFVAACIVAVIGLAVGGKFRPFMNWLARHPLADAKFFFFIFCLIPVQTLFAHNWLTLPMYVERAYRWSWPGISQKFEIATSFNALLIFVLVPIVTALTQKRKVYNMMIVGTFVMAAPTFLLALGAKPWTLVSYIVIMTIGEAMWQPRFLQYAAEIAPEGRTGEYMGVAQFPWFLTKVIVPFYAGWFLLHYCPDTAGLPEGAPPPANMHTQTMWLIYGFIAISSCIMLILAKGWIGRDFKTKAA